MVLIHMVTWLYFFMVLIHMVTYGFLSLFELNLVSCSFDYVDDKLNVCLLYSFNIKKLLHN